MRSLRSLTPNAMCPVLLFACEVEARLPHTRQGSGCVTCKVLVRRPKVQWYWSFSISRGLKRHGAVHEYEHWHGHLTAPEAATDRGQFSRRCRPAATTASAHSKFRVLNRLRLTNPCS